jgi:uncharacterized membrane protein (DUF485 family)
MSSGHWDFGDELDLTDEQRATLHERVQAGPEFRALRRRMRGFAFPMAAAFLLWYLAFVLLASYARDLMARPVLGEINLGLALGLAQFVTTFALTAGYVRYARNRLDPLAAQIRTAVEDGPGRAGTAATARVAPVDRPRVVAMDGPWIVAMDGARVGSAR